MSIRQVIHYAFSMTGAAVLLSGCGGSQPPIDAPGAMSQECCIL